MEENISHITVNPHEHKDNQSDLFKQTESVVFILPKQCKPWRYADRDLSEMGDLKSLENSIKKHGQQEPILLRPSLNSGSEIKYDIIFGHRRWLACSHLNIPIKSIIKPLSDIESAIAQKAENEFREDLSDYAKALFYKKLLDDQIFQNEKELSKSLQISKQTLNDVMSYTRIHPEIMANIQKPHLLTKKLASKLATLSSKISTGSMKIDYLKAMIQIAPEIDSGQISSRALENRLKQIVEKTKSEKEMRKNKYFSITRNSYGNIHIVVNKSSALSCQLERLEKEIYDIITFFIKIKQQSDRPD